MSEKVPCAICQTSKASKTCGLCASKVCKSCTETLDTKAFIFLMKIPEKFSHAHYCARCWDTEVAPALADYEVMAEKARNVYFITKNYPGYVRVLQRHTAKVTVEDCPDRREGILKMAYVAAELGFNAIIDAEMTSFIKRNEAYQSSYWRGSCLPARINGEQLERTSQMRI